MLLVLLFVAPVAGRAEQRSIDDVRFMGPLITSGTDAYVPGHFYLQSYLGHTHTRGGYDDDGNRHRLDARADESRLRMLVGYGFSRRLTGQLGFTGGHSTVDDLRSDGVRLGDTTAKLKYVLRERDATSGGMALSVHLSQSLATGRHDRLDGNPLNASGDGGYRSGASLVGQKWLWMPNGRPLRGRWQLTWSPSPASVSVEGASVHGTDRGFDGRVRMGARHAAAVGMEYSINRNWALALDLAVDWQRPDALRGSAGAVDGEARWITRRGPSRRSHAIAPAVEYLFGDRAGLLFGVEASLPGGRNSPSFVSPQLSLLLAY